MTKTLLLNNRYQIQKTIGKGGFSQTFLAIDTHLPSGRKCVIKQLTPITQDPENWQWVQDRFQREAAILEQLGKNNSQIPELFAYFSEGGNFYLAQEWIAGETLRQKQQQQGNFSPDEVHKILVSLLPILDYVHNQRMVHRDIKPDNIILRSSDNLPVLIDFGAVKEAMGTIVNSQGNSTVSVAIGTPGYMASEQAAGRPLYSSDIYSLGLSAVFLLTGKNPQELVTESRTGEYLWRREVPDLHSNLVTVIEKAIRFHPRDRYSSAAQMLAALQSISIASTASTAAATPQPPSISSTAATAVVAPGNPSSNLQSNSSTAATVAVEQPTTATTEVTTPKSNGCLKFLFAIIALGGVSITAFVMSFNAIVSRFLPSSPSPTPPTTVEETIIPSPTPTPSKEPEIIPSPEASPSPTPEATPEVKPSPTPTPAPQPPESGGSINIPTFTLGSTENQIKVALGEPSDTRNGYWHNTTALSYGNVGSGVSLKYIFDRETGKLRQTQVTFDQSVDLALMQKTLDGLFNGKAPKIAHQGLETVYQRQKSRQWIPGKDLQGLIQRNSRDRIYIEVSAGDFP